MRSSEQGNKEFLYLVLQSTPTYVNEVAGYSVIAPSFLKLFGGRRLTYAQHNIVRDFWFGAKVRTEVRALQLQLADRPHVPST